MQRTVTCKSSPGIFIGAQPAVALAPVLATLEAVVHEASPWREITTLLILGIDDADGGIAALRAWIYARQRPAVSLHFSAFHPDWKMRDSAARPPVTD